MAATDSIGYPVFVSPARQGGWHLMLWVQPGAKKTEFAGVQDECLRVRLAAPAVENKANKALVSLIAECLGLKKAQVILAAGESSRRKCLYIESGSEPDWTRLLDP
jgi:Uncharacterized conserved protein